MQEKPYLRGDIYYADLGQGVGSEQRGYRPVLILQNNTGNRYSQTVIVASISSQSQIAHTPLHRYKRRLGSAIRCDAGADPNDR